MNALLAFIVWCWRRCQQWLCGLRGHDRVRRYERDRLLLVCSSCGHLTPGWLLDEPLPHLRFAGDPVRHRLKTWQPIVAPKDLLMPTPAVAVAVARSGGEKKPTPRSSDHSEARLAAHRALCATRWHEGNAALSFAGMQDAQFGSLCQSYVHLLAEHKRVAPARMAADARD